MRYCSYLCAGLVCTIANTSLFAAENINTEATPTEMSRLESLKQLKQLKLKDLKINANAAQEEHQKDPLQPLNRQIYSFNDAIDRTVLRPVAVQYTQTVPEKIRGSLTLARKNLDEPWNAVNQIIQGKPVRAAKTLGRFTINTLTTLGFADPAQYLGLSSEDESFGTTLGYYGVPSGPYLVLPILGPSTLRDSLGIVADSQARPQKYVLNDYDGLYWSELTWRAIDTRARLLDVENILQGDKYAALRDVYLQRKNFQIAEKKGLNAESIGFIDDLNDDFDDDIETNDQSPVKNE